MESPMNSSSISGCGVGVTAALDITLTADTPTQEYMDSDSLMTRITDSSEAEGRST